MAGVTILADTALYTGLAYLSGIVTFQLVRYDLSSSKVAQRAALDHYATRKSADLSYKIAPFACVSLFVGVVLNLYFRTSQFGSWVTLAAAFGTAFNNGRNVVNPVNQWIAKKDTDDKNVDSMLAQVQKGHLIDLVGFAIIFISATYF